MESTLEGNKVEIYHNLLLFQSKYFDKRSFYNIVSSSLARLILVQMLRRGNDQELHVILLHSEQPKLHRVLAVLSAMVLILSDFMLRLAGPPT